MSTGDVLRLRAYTSIGRSLDNTIVLLDKSVSVVHAVLVYRDGRWWIEDRNSTNGTTVNGAAISDQTVVHHHDVIGIGQIRLKLETL